MKSGMCCECRKALAVHYELTADHKPEKLPYHREIYPLHLDRESQRNFEESNA